MAYHSAETTGDLWRERLADSLPTRKRARYPHLPTRGTLRGTAVASLVSDLPSRTLVLAFSLLKSHGKTMRLLPVFVAGKSYHNYRESILGRSLRPH